MAEDRKKGKGAEGAEKSKKKGKSSETPRVKRVGDPLVTERNKLRRNITAAAKADPTAYSYLDGKLSKAEMAKIAVRGENALDKRNAKKESVYASPAARARRAAKAAARRARKAACIAAEEAIRAEAEAVKAAEKPADEEADEITADLSAAEEEYHPH